MQSELKKSSELPQILREEMPIPKFKVLQDDTEVSEDESTLLLKTEDECPKTQK